jgi:cold-inducible RNA-binding protein
MRLFIANIPFSTVDEDLIRAFGKFGKLTSVVVSTDKHTGEPRGFAFVEFAQRSDGEAAIREMHGKSVHGRRIQVNEAQAREATDGRFGARNGHWM